MEATASLSTGTLACSFSPSEAKTSHGLRKPRLSVAAPTSSVSSQRVQPQARATPTCRLNLHPWPQPARQRPGKQTSSRSLLTRASAPAGSSNQADTQADSPNPANVPLSSPQTGSTAGQDSHSNSGQFSASISSSSGPTNPVSFQGPFDHLTYGLRSLLATVPASASASGFAPALMPPQVMVDCFEVEQCERLTGHVSISGAKNSALAVLAGAICSQEPLVLRRIPDLHDIRRMFQVLQSIGVKVERGVDGLSDAVSVDASSLTSVQPCPDVVRKLRASFFVIGALAGRQGEAIVPLPGGCNIGARPIDLHVRGLEAVGAKVEINQGRVHVKARRADGRLTGGHFYLDFPSVGATETLMMAAALADGETVLSNVAQEPEVVDLADFLISCGAQIRGAGTNTICIKGVPRLGPSDFTIIPDRIETGTFLIAAAITRSTISLSPVVPRHLTAVICKLREIGCRVQQTQIGTLTISPACRHLLASDVTTLPYPGFPTDLQPQLMSLLTACKGQSVVKETVFESRMRHVEELQKMGALIKVSGSTAIVSGVDEGSQLYGAPVMATDLRAGAALVIAGMAAGGKTHIEGVCHIDRGYEHIDGKLRGLGAKVQRLPCLPSELRL